LLDFTNGYEANSALVEMAVREFGKPATVARQAWAAAVRIQTQVEGALQELGRQALARAVAEGKPAILLAGRSYNAFTPEGSQRWARNSPAWASRPSTDCLAPVGKGRRVALR
jgi:predicted nucleotide-binding protein (sugar kinase/HSP70/actin superfamily)